MKLRRRARREPEVAVQIGFAGIEADIATVQQQTHDMLIESLGSRRRSGVTWIQYDASKAPEVLDKLGIDLAEGDIARWLADWPEGFLIVAMAEMSTS